MTGAGGQNEIRTIADIPGWFSGVDPWLFERFLSDNAVVTHGDLVEIGVYLGKSAALIGTYKRPDEIFTVCDLFGGEAEDPLNVAENDKSYSTLTREKFEHNYLSLHRELPVVVQDLSSAILAHVKPESARFVHVDASHLYEHVAVDIESARTMLLAGGVVAFDDFRSPHTPGVAAAVWEAVFTKGLHPICLTGRKMYATFGDPRPHRERVEAWLATSERWDADLQQIAGAPVVRIKDRPVSKPARAIRDADIRQLSVQLTRQGKRLASVDRKVTRLQRELGTGGRSLLERGLRRAVRMVRPDAGRRSAGGAV